MSRIDNWLEFWGKIGPAMLDLGQTIFRETGGDVPKALAAIRRVKDHWGEAYQQAEDRVDAQLDALEQAAPPAPDPGAFEARQLPEPEPGLERRED